MKKAIKSTVVLVGICAVMAILLAVTNALTAPIIAENQNAAANQALLQVMPNGEGFESVEFDAEKLPKTIKEVFKEKNKQITRRRFLPSPMLEKYTRIEYRRDKDNEHTIGVINEFTGHNAPNLRVKMEYDYDSGCLTMTGNSWHDIQKINMKLDDYYYTWLRSSEAADYMATGAKDKNNKHLSALATHPIIPIEFNACPLSHALAYLNLHPLQ